MRDSGDQSGRTADGGGALLRADGHALKIQDAAHYAYEVAAQSETSNKKQCTRVSMMLSDVQCG